MNITKQQEEMASDYVSDYQKFISRNRHSLNGLSDAGKLEKYLKTYREAN